MECCFYNKQYTSGIQDNQYEDFIGEINQENGLYFGNILQDTIFKNFDHVHDVEIFYANNLPSETDESDVDEENDDSDILFEARNVNFCENQQMY